MPSLSRRVQVTDLFHFVQTAKGAYASDRITFGFPATEAGNKHRASLGVVFRIGRRFGSMPEPPASHPPGTITVLSFSPAENDYDVLEQTFRESSLTLYPNCRLALRRSQTVASTIATLRTQRIPIVLCDLDGQPKAWQEILRASRELVRATLCNRDIAGCRRPLVVGRAQRGAFDLLSKPFDKSNVIRIFIRPGCTGRTGTDRRSRRESEESASGM